MPVDRDLTPKNYDPIDPNKSVFAAKQSGENNNRSLSGRRSPSAAKSLQNDILQRLGTSIKDIWVTHVQKHHSKHLVYQGMNLNRRLLEMNLEIFAQVSTNIGKDGKEDGKVQTFQEEKLKIVRRITESIKGFNKVLKENELKKNIEIEIEKEFLTKYLESESEEDEKSEDDEDLIT